MRFRPEPGWLLAEEAEHDGLNGVHPRKEAVQRAEAETDGGAEQVREFADIRVALHYPDQTLPRGLRGALPREIERRDRAEERDRVVASVVALVRLLEIELDRAAAHDVDANLRLLPERHDGEPVVLGAQGGPNVQCRQVGLLRERSTAQLFETVGAFDA